MAKKKTGKSKPRQKPARAQSADNSAGRLRFIPRSVARGLETLEAYSMQKVNEEAIRQSAEQAKQDRFRQACEQCRKLLADSKVWAYWLNQAQTVMESENDWQGPGGVGFRYEWPRDKAKVYAIMAIAADFYSGIKILPDKLRKTEFYKVNKHIDYHIAEFDLTAEFLSYIEADLEAEDHITKPDRGKRKDKQIVKRNHKQIDLPNNNSQGFKFDGEKQAKYNGIALNIPSGRAVKVLKVLVDSMPNIASHEQVNEAAEQSKTAKAEEQTRYYVTTIREALLKQNIPYKIVTKHGAGYSLKARGKKPK